MGNYLLNSPSIQRVHEENETYHVTIESSWHFSGCLPDATRRLPFMSKDNLDILFKNSKCGFHISLFVTQCHGRREKKEKKRSVGERLRFD